MTNNLNPAGYVRFSLLALCAALGALALCAPSAPAAEVTSHRFRFAISQFRPEPSPKPPQVLEDPCGVALDSHGDIYVADYYHDQIAIFDPAVAT
jgi:DNA-binding beta-propeller fold protein YncE